MMTITTNKRAQTMTVRIDRLEASRLIDDLSQAAKAYTADDRPLLAEIAQRNADQIWEAYHAAFRLGE